MLRTTSSQSVLKSRWLTVRKERVQLPSGGYVDDYYIAKKSDFAMIAALTPDNQIILVQEWKHGVKDYVLGLPAGGIDPEESPTQAVTRELLEETGYRVKTLKFLGSYYVACTWLEDRAFLFLGTGAERVQDPKIDESEEIIVKLVDFDEVLDMVFTNQLGDPYSNLSILLVARILKS